jgi:formylmethanofuran dehydrogenase subunit C
VIKLNLRDTSPIPLEVFGIIPERLHDLSALEIAKIPIQHGNREAPLGEFFDVTKQSSHSSTIDLRFTGETRNVKGIGAGMSSGAIHVDGSAGMHAGARMAGGTLRIEGAAGDWLGAEMQGGRIEVFGAAGSLVGAAYRGARRGMLGGSIFVHGNAGDEVGLFIRRGMIAIGGVCGDFAGASMIAGTLALLGGAGARLGAGMKRGTIITGGKVSLPGSFRYACRFRPSFLHLLHRQLSSFPSADTILSGSFQCFRGDLLTGGYGEVLVPHSSNYRDPTK